MGWEQTIQAITDVVVRQKIVTEAALGAATSKHLDALAENLQRIREELAFLTATMRDNLEMQRKHVDELAADRQLVMQYAELAGQYFADQGGGQPIPFRTVQQESSAEEAGNPDA
jgi:hypothetical protein